MTCTWQRKHLKNCSHCPAAILEKYKRRKENDTRGRKAYWEKAAKQVRNAGCICAFLSFHHLPGLILIYPSPKRLLFSHRPRFAIHLIYQNSLQIGLVNMVDGEDRASGITFSK
mmetsp:Transcript_8325/g.16935  ORF Transcript_8325/g.16935 Transcript_8325/m.16935 type:complete len:114 (+) Transcript_8325:671-1012(+)